MVQESCGMRLGTCFIKAALSMDATMAAVSAMTLPAEGFLMQGNSATAY